MGGGGGPLHVCMYACIYVHMCLAMYTLCVFAGRGMGGEGGPLHVCMYVCMNMYVDMCLVIYVHVLAGRGGGRMVYVHTHVHKTYIYT